MRVFIVLALGVIAWASACGTDGPPAVPQTANAVTEGDPRAAGERQFFFDTWGTEALGDWPPTDFMLALQHDEPAVFGDQYAAFGFLPDPDDDLPIGFKRGIADPSRVHETCALCHVGVLPDGRVWMGAPNQRLDIGRFRAEVNARWVAAGHQALLSQLGSDKARQLGPGRFDAESGEYPTVVPADFPPYFNLAKRTRLNYLGTGGDVRTEASFAIYSFGAGSPKDETALVPFPTEARLDSFVEFFGTIDPPGAPAGDAAQIARGQAVFKTARCDTCHHIGDVVDLGADGVIPYAKDGVERLPGDDPAWPLGAIATDRAHRALVDDVQMGGMIDTGYLDLLNFIAAHQLHVQSSDGYRASDLRGLWATAPYLHNGSVPTLEALFTPPAARPQRFDRAGFSVDTTTVGNGNGGHAFGTTLSAEDKTALIAYLNSL